MSKHKILYNVKFSKELNDMFASVSFFERHISMMYRNKSVYFFGHTGYYPVSFTDVYLNTILKESKRVAQEDSDVRKLKDIIYDEGIKAGLIVDFPSLKSTIPKDARNITSVNVYINDHINGKPHSIEYRFTKMHEDTTTVLSILVNANGRIDIGTFGDDDGIIGFNSDILLEILENSFIVLKAENISRTEAKDIIRRVICSNSVCRRVLFT